MDNPSPVSGSGDKPDDKSASVDVPNTEVEAPSSTEQVMHIHAPKPVHGWRELATEVGVIVIGILIALGLEQAIESWHEHERVDNARSSIDAEMRFNLAKADILAEMRDCTERQIGVIAAAIGRNDQPELRRVLSQVQLPQGTSWNDAAWRTALSSGVSDRFEENDSRYLPVTYEIVSGIKDVQKGYFDAYFRLGFVAQQELSGSSAATAMELSEITGMASALRTLQLQITALRGVATEMLHLEAGPADRARVPQPDQVGKCQAAAASLGSGAK